MSVRVVSVNPKNISSLSENPCWQALIAALRSELGAREDRVRALTEDNAALLGRVSELRQRCEAAEGLCASLAHERSASREGAAGAPTLHTDAAGAAAVCGAIEGLRGELMSALRGMVDRELHASVLPQLPADAPSAPTPLGRTEGERSFPLHCSERIHA